jgi:hypothetical protein
MADVDHQALAAEARADGAVLHGLSERMHDLRLTATQHTGAELDALRLEVAQLSDEFGVLHNCDMSGDLDRRAHGAWRARVRRLTARLDRLTEPGATGSEG